MAVTSRQRLARKKFQASGYSLLGACAIVGNLVQESRAHLDSTVERGRRADHGSGGIAEWRLDRKDNLKRFAAMRGADVNSIEIQCDFLVHELQTDYPKLDRQLREGKRSIENLTANFCFIFERPSRRLRPDGTSIANLDGRIKFAKANLADSRKDVVVDGGAVVAVGSGASAFFLSVQEHPYVALGLLVVAALAGIVALWSSRRPAESPDDPQETEAPANSLLDRLRVAQDRLVEAIEIRDALLEQIRAEAKEVEDLLAAVKTKDVSISYISDKEPT